MPYRPEADLKRPDLKGNFLCGHCGKKFCHAASLNRHRLNFHGDDQICQICDEKIAKNETIRRHMALVHKIHRVFTCGCCNWTFPDKKELHSHNNSMQKTGLPGDAVVIARSSRKPGSLSQHELRGEPRIPRGKKRAHESSASTRNADPNELMSLINTLLSANLFQPAAPIVEEKAPVVPPTEWINRLLQVNPALLPFFPQMQSSASPTTSTSSEMDTAEPSTLETVLAAINNNEGEASTSRSEETVDVENMDDGKELLVKAVGADFLSVKTEQPVSASFDSAESGIGSGPVSHTPSPSTTPPTTSGASPSSAAGFLTDALKKAKRANKHRSVDDICFNLCVKRSFAT